MSQTSANSPRANEHLSSIRAGNRDDLPSILNVEQSALSAAHWNAEHYRNRIESQPRGACFQVAEGCDSDGKSQICGFLCARIVGGEWEIENVVVQSSLRRRGLASQLLQSLISEWAAAAGTALHLEVRESNTAARALYERHGFREIGRRPAYYRDPDESAILYSLNRS
jgi:ribosomal-protein-alanine N-acetyltransferase